MFKKENLISPPAPHPLFPALEELEERLEMQMLEGPPADADFCVWFVCTDVCPPDGELEG